MCDALLCSDDAFCKVSVAKASLTWAQHFFCHSMVSPAFKTGCFFFSLLSVQQWNFVLCTAHLFMFVLLFSFSVLKVAREDNLENPKMKANATQHTVFTIMWITIQVYTWQILWDLFDEVILINIVETSFFLKVFFCAVIALYKSLIFSNHHE